MFFVVDLNPGDRDPSNDGATDRFGWQRFEQHDEATGVTTRHDAFDRDLVLELGQIDVRCDDGTLDTQYIETLTWFLGLIADQDYARLLEVRLRLLLLVVLTSANEASGVDEGVERLGRNLHPVAALYLLESVARHQLPIPKSDNAPYG